MTSPAPCGHGPVEWVGCYAGNWDYWVDEAMAHPAKMSPTLCFKILTHLKDLGLLGKGAVILDPMAGIFTTGLCACIMGYASIGVELEEHFVQLAKANINKLAERLCTCGKGYNSLPMRHMPSTISGEGFVSGKEKDGLATGDILQPSMFPQEAAQQGDTSENECRTQGKKMRASESLVEGRTSDGQGVLDVESERTQSLRAPPYYGATFGSASDTSRESSSSKRGQVGQQNREPLADKRPSSHAVTPPEWEDIGTTLPKVCEACGKPVTPFPVIIQGDSRHLAELLQERGLCAITSPPYLETKQEARSPGDKLVWGNKRYGRQDNRTESYTDYGSAPGQIGNLPDRPLVGITSPPYLNSKGTQDKDFLERLGTKNPDASYRIRTPWAGDAQDYGSTEGQIGALPDRPLVSITSPPYEDAINAPTKGGIDWNKNIKKAWRPSKVAGGIHFNNPMGIKPLEYGKAEGQIGQERNETYLSAMRQVFAQIALVADVLVSVSKDPTRNGKLRPLGADLQRLMEETGWRIVCHHKAILFTEQEQGHLFEGTRKQVKGRMSFFKRLSYRKGSPVAQWEDVLVAVREGPGGGCKVITSAPYQTSEGISITRRNRQVVAHSWAVTDEKPRDDGYGPTPGQIGNLKVITSPPFLDIVAAQDKAFYTKKCIQTGRNPSSHHAQGIDSYGDTPGQIGKLKG